MKKTQLTATRQKSYYGKATVRQEDNKLILTSYNTDVVYIDLINGNFVKLWSGYSKTTLNHINDFLGTNLNKQGWLDIPCDNSEEVYNIYISNGFFTHKYQALLTTKECEKEIEKVRNNRVNIFAWYDWEVIYNEVVEVYNGYIWIFPKVWFSNINNNSDIYYGMFNSRNR